MKQTCYKQRFGIQLKKPLRNGCLGSQVYTQIFKKVGSCQLSTAIVLQYCIQNENTIPSRRKTFTLSHHIAKLVRFTCRTLMFFSRNPLEFNRREAKYCQWRKSDPPVFKRSNKLRTHHFPEWAKLTMSTVVKPRSLLLNQKKSLKKKGTWAKLRFFVGLPFANQCFTIKTTTIAATGVQKTPKTP